jgi:hypothetical protein
MRKKLSLLATLVLLLIASMLVWLPVSGRVTCLVVKRAKIEVNGVPALGEMLGNSVNAIVTMRTAGKEHSYRLYFAGDVDSTGDMGQVVDCAQWVAPHLPLLIETRDYPPCLLGSQHGPREPLVSKGKSMQFAGEGRSTIRIAF